MAEPEWREALGAIKAPRDVTGWRLAVVLDVDDKGAAIGVERVAGNYHRIPFSDVGWARRRLRAIEVESSIDDSALEEGLAEDLEAILSTSETEESEGGLIAWLDEDKREIRETRRKVKEIVKLGPPLKMPSDLWSVGDVVLVSPMARVEGSRVQEWSLRQVPEVQGAFMAMNARSGRVLAMQGGFSFQASSFNRAHAGAAAARFRHQAGDLCRGAQPGIHAGNLDSRRTVGAGPGRGTRQMAADELHGALFGPHLAAARAGGVSQFGNGAHCPGYWARTGR